MQDANRASARYNGCAPPMIPVVDVKEISAGPRLDLRAATIGPAATTLFDMLCL